MQPKTNSEHRQIYLIDALNCYFSSQSFEQLSPSSTVAVLDQF